MNEETIYKVICRGCFIQKDVLHRLPDSIPPNSAYQSTPATLLMGKLFRRLLSRHSTTFDRICTNCRDEMERTYLFVKRCEISNSYIQNHLPMINARKVSIPPILQTIDIDDDDDDDSNSGAKEQSFIITGVTENLADTSSQHPLMKNYREITEIDQLDNSSQIDQHSNNEIFVKQEILTNDEMRSETDNSFPDSKILVNDNVKPFNSLPNCIDIVEEISIEQTIKQEDNVIPFNSFSNCVGITEETSIEQIIKQEENVIPFKSLPNCVDTIDGTAAIEPTIKQEDNVIPNCINIIEETSIEQTIKLEPDLDINMDEDVSGEFIDKKLCNITNAELRCDSEPDFFNDLPEKVIECTLCRKKFQNASKFHNHNLTPCASTPAKLECTNCNESFRYKLGLMNHIRTKHKNAKLTCPICTANSVCPKLFEKPSERMAHMKREHKHQFTSQFTCDVCCVDFAKKRCLVNHRRTHRHMMKLRTILHDFSNCN